MPKWTFGGLWPIFRESMVLFSMKPDPVPHRLPQRRASVRFQLSLPVIFSWGELEKHTAGGFTTNVSLGGAFVLSDQCPPEDTEVKLDLMLKSLDDQGSKINLQSVGSVTRVVKKREKDRLVGFAVAGCFSDENLLQLVAD
jgi:PilZ domain